MRTVQEEDEVPRSHETLNEQHQQQQQTQLQQQHQPQLAPQNLRKASIVSEDSDIFLASNKMYGVAVTSMTGTEPMTIKPPYLSMKGHHETTSTDSKDTLTPIDAVKEPQTPIIISSISAGSAVTTAVAITAAATSISVVDDDDNEEDASTENIMELNFETARQKAQRRRSMGMGRRLSECCSNYDLNRSQTSLNAALAMSRRQLSLTQSEPDDGNETTGIQSECEIVRRVTLMLFSISHTPTHHSLDKKESKRTTRVPKLPAF